MPEPENRRTAWLTADRLTLAGLLVFSLLVRGSVLWAMRGNLDQDPDAYREIAENLLRHGEFALDASPGWDLKPYHVTAYRPPLYPVVLSNLPTADRQNVSLLKVAVLHVLLGVATVWLTWLTARRVGCARRECQMVGTAHPTLASFVAGLIVACDPILLNQQSLVMTETLAAFLAILSLWCLARFGQSRSWFNAALAGGAIGLAVLCRPTFLPWLGLVGFAMLLVRMRMSEVGGQRSGRSWLDDVGWRTANLAGLVITAAAVISPWAIRNYRVFGKPIVTTTHGGYTLLLGNNDSFYDWLINDKSGIPWSANKMGMRTLEHRNLAVGADPPSLSFLSEGEFGFDRENYLIARQNLRTSPALFGRACLFRLGQLWSPLPHKLTADESPGRRVLRYATCAWYCGIYLLAALGIWRISGGSVGTAHPTAMLRPPWVWGVLLCLAFTAVHTFYWTNLRMRAPLMPFVALVAAAAIHTSPKRERW